MKRKLFSLTVIALVSILLLAGCGKYGKDPSTAETSTSTQTQTAAVVDPNAPLTINEKLVDKEIMSKGPDGENAVSAKTLKLTPEDLKKIKAGNYTAAIVMHYAGNDWSTAQIKGIEEAMARMGIKIIAKTDANFKPEKQVSDIETVMAKKPDVIIAIPVDPASTADAFKRAAAQGTKIVFMDNKPTGLTAGKDYVSVVSADNYGNGIVAADLMAEAIGKKGEIGVIYHDADFFVTKQRTEAFEKTIQEHYPDIKIVDRGGIAGPNDGEKVAAALLTKHPNMKGMFVVWDVPAEGAMAAARTAGRNDLAITTIDLGTNVAYEIAQGGIIRGLGAQLPYDQGIAESILAGYALLGKKAPSYVAVPSLSVSQSNLADSWKTVYHSEVPDLIKKALKK
ncbi:Ribose import binding protein RbsB [Paenibacillus polymyxa E681]|uniref:substrate-binding domain-containing protein n=1 Tax=Paenibacillus polymyxa TaxID=1406 RepID=UPI0001E316FF|nr:substrate-binding domain-containing protein [Paenibacillus polymyxa]ADM68707.1 sugar ABC transporter substrate-binding protein [Paenibacillus polymyxa E681]QNV55713.1 Ribose import binding protein RbsB [Paenibacillus polymyxa E681]QNV60549.1 Ribose import binding protein RbsB [Paenibacillus polymyxa E681]